MHPFPHIGAMTRAIGVAAYVLVSCVTPAAAAPANPQANLAPPSRPFVPKKPFLKVSYDCILLGPLAYDEEPDVYHAFFYEPDYPRDRHHEAVFKRNAEMWEERMPSLLQAAGKCADSDTKMVLQLGHLVQGDCGTPELYRKMLQSAIGKCKAAFPRTPFLTTPAPQDRKGPGAQEAYDKTIPAFLSKELRHTVNGGTFCLMQGPDLFLFIDEAKPDLDEIEKAFRDHQIARYKFVISASPVIPIDDANAPLLLFKNKPDPRRRMRELFLKNDVIVLSAAGRLMELSEVMTDSGRITQLLVNSLYVRGKMAVPKEEASGAREYGKFQPSREEIRKKKKRDHRPLLYEYKNALSRYERYRFAGFAVLKISGDGVVAEIHGGDSADVTKTIKLR